MLLDTENNKGITIFSIKFDNAFMDQEDAVGKRVVMVDYIIAVVLDFHKLFNYNPHKLVVLSIC